MQRALRKAFDAARNGRIAIVLVVCAVAIWRFLQAAPLVFPPWVDSVHHALLARILVEQGRIPDTWAPYLPDVPFYYHFGFHLSAAALAKLLGFAPSNVAQAVLLAGQLWQTAAAGGVYLLCRSLGQSRRAALLALLLVGFVSEMPGYYLAWGRFTLLAGVALLIYGMWAALTGRQWWLATCVAAAAITHYYAFLLLVAFCVIHALVDGRRRATVSIAAVVGVCAAAPWLARVAVWLHALSRSEDVLPGTGEMARMSVLTMLGPWRNYTLLAFALSGLLVFVCRCSRQKAEVRDYGLIAFAIWTIALLALMGPWEIGPFRPDHAALLVFIPAVVFAARMLDAIPTFWLRNAAIGILLVWGGVENARVVSPKTIIANEEDERAIQWIDQNTRHDDVVLIDVEHWGGLWRGSDGGAWITPTTGRRTVMPGIPYAWGFSGSRRRIDALAEETAALPFLLPPEYCAALEKVMERAGATHYYTRWPRPGQCANMHLLYQSGVVRVLTRATFSRTLPRL